MRPTGTDALPEPAAREHCPPSPSLVAGRPRAKQHHGQGVRRRDVFFPFSIRGSRSVLGAERGWCIRRKKRSPRSRSPHLADAREGAPCWPGTDATPDLSTPALVRARLTPPPLQPGATVVRSFRLAAHLPRDVRFNPLSPPAVAQGAVGSTEGAHICASLHQRATRRGV